MKIKQRRSACPVACFLDILGDKWTLLVIRDIFRGHTRYNDFLKSDENITTNILADRLKRLEQEKIIDKTPYQTNPVRYEYHLTEMGRDLKPVFKALMAWARKYYEDVIKSKD
jgi:DNA-binding HxlR family transcriptional regulator